MSDPLRPRAGCPFCPIPIAQDKLLHFNDGNTIVAFEPLDPVTPGHFLVVPRHHVEDFTTAPMVSGLAMAAAARWAKRIGDCNLITSKGPYATQTVHHLHIHVVPRHPGDGLHLPWTDQLHRTV